MDNPGKLAAQVTQDEEKENKTHNTIYVRHHYTQTNTNNMKKTWTLGSYKQLEVKTNRTYADIICNNIQNSFD